MKTLSFFLSTVLVCMASAQRPIVHDNSYEHTKWGIAPSDLIFEYAAYTSSFDGADDNDGDGQWECWGIPEWVAFEIKGNVPEHPLANRPTWFTDPLLHSRGIAPDDDTYAVSGTRELPVVKGDYRFVRGHMCPKDTAERVSEDAAYNTHTVINAVPQLQWQNNGIWKALEQQCVQWADQCERVWVVCGPVFFAKSPALWLGQRGEVLAAIPDALFKVVIRQDGATVKTAAFLIPNILPQTEKDYWKFAVSIDEIEADTGLDFLTVLSEQDQAAVESVAAVHTEW